MRITLTYIRNNNEYMVKVVNKSKFTYKYFDLKEDAIHYIEEVKKCLKN